MQMNTKLKSFGQQLTHDIFVRAGKIEKERQNMAEDKDEIDWGSDNETAEMHQARIVTS